MTERKRQPDPSRCALALTLVAALAAAGLATGCAKDEGATKDAPEAADPSQAQADGAGTDVDWLTLEEEDLLPVIDQLGESLQAAHLALDRKDPTAAAAQVRGGASYLESEMNQATKTQKARLEEAAARLRGVADDLDRGFGVDANRLTRAFQDAYAADTQERWSVLEEDILLPHADAPENHFLKAEKALSAEDTHQASMELRKGLAFMRLEMSRNDEQAAPALSDAEKNLQGLANDIEDGNLEETGNFERFVADADLALAEAHLSRAERAWKDDNTDRAATGLESSSDYLERAATWAGTTLDPDETARLTETHSLSGAMLSDREWKHDQVAEALEGLGKVARELHTDLAAQEAQQHVEPALPG